MEGTLHDFPPTPKRVKDNHDWDQWALKARENVGKAVLAGENFPDTRAKSLRMRNREPYVTDEGSIVVSVRDSYIADDGRRYGDIYFHWVPKEEEEEGK